MTCFMCKREDLADRTFYEEGDWFAFMAAVPSLTRGHVIVARISQDSCPDEFNASTIAGAEAALADVSSRLRARYGCEVLLASLRGKTRHMHFHLVPLRPEEEKEWRLESRWEKGHLFEYLGHLEGRAVAADLTERIEKGWSEEKQREEHVRSFKDDVQALGEKPPSGAA